MQYLHRQPTLPRSEPVRLVLEVLEDRTVPSFFGRLPYWFDAPGAYQEPADFSGDFADAGDFQGSTEELTVDLYITTFDGIYVDHPGNLADSPDVIADDVSVIGDDSVPPDDFVYDTGLDYGEPTWPDDILVPDEGLSYKDISFVEEPGFDGEVVTKSDPSFQAGMPIYFAFRQDILLNHEPLLDGDDSIHQPDLFANATSEAVAFATSLAPTSTGWPAFDFALLSTFTDFNSVLTNRNKDVFRFTAE